MSSIFIISGQGKKGLKTIGVGPTRGEEKDVELKCIKVCSFVAKEGAINCADIVLRLLAMNFTTLKQKVKS